MSLWSFGDKNGDNFGVHFFFFNLMLEYLIMYGVSNMIECFKIMLRHSIWCIYFGWWDRLIYSMFLCIYAWDVLSINFLLALNFHACYEFSILELFQYFFYIPIRVMGLFIVLGFIQDLDSSTCDLID
jgi:hypothetical protein